MESEILKEINPEKYSQVLELLKKDWTDSLHMYYFVKNCINWTYKTDCIHFRLYCTKDEGQDWVVVMIVMFKTTLATMIMFHTPDEGLLNLEKVLRNTKVIDWTQKLHIQAVHEKFISILSTVVKEKKLSFSKTGYYQLWMPPEKSKTIELDDLSATQLELRDLEDHHSEIINRTWPYSAPGTEQFIKDIIIYNGGVGLFFKGSDNPIAWSLIQHYHGIGMLYTLEEYRKKGYGSIVTKAISKRLADAGNDPFACTKYGNSTSLAMFKNLGFEETNLMYLCESTAS